MSSPQPQTRQPEGFVQQQAPDEVIAGDAVPRGRPGVPEDLERRDVAAAAGRAAGQVAKSRSPLARFARFVLFVALGFGGATMCLGALLSAARCIGSFYITEFQFGYELFSVFFFGYLGWAGLWLALRVSPWGKPGRRWVRIVLTTGGALLLTAGLLSMSGLMAFLFERPHRGSGIAVAELTGTWDLVLEESSQDFGFSEIQSGTLEFLGNGQAIRTLYLKRYGEVTEHVTRMEGLDWLPAGHLRFRLPETGATHEIFVQRNDDTLSFLDWESYGTETFRRRP